MYTFICTTGVSFGFGDSSWPGGRFSRLLTMWEKFSPFLSVFSTFFSPSPYVRKFFSISHSVSLRENIFLAFSLCEKFFLTWIGSYVRTPRTCFSPSPYVRKIFSVSHSSFSMWEKFSLFLLMWENSSPLLPYKRKIFSPSHLGEKIILTYEKYGWRERTPSRRQG